MLQQLEAYIEAQKLVGLHFIWIGVALTVLGVLCWLWLTGNLAHGLRLGAFVCGLMMVLGGVGYRATEARLLNERTEQFEQEPQVAVEIEARRMETVVRQYPMYQYGFAAMILIGLSLVLVAPSERWHGVGFVLVFTFACVMLSEAFSKRSIDAYHAWLQGADQARAAVQHGR